MPMHPRVGLTTFLWIPVCAYVFRSLFLSLSMCIWQELGAVQMAMPGYSCSAMDVHATDDLLVVALKVRRTGAGLSMQCGHHVVLCVRISLSHTHTYIHIHAHTLCLLCIVAGAWARRARRAMARRPLRCMGLEREVGHRCLPCVASGSRRPSPSCRHCVYVFARAHRETDTHTRATICGYVCVVMGGAASWPACAALLCVRVRVCVCVYWGRRLMGRCAAAQAMPRGGHVLLADSAGKGRTNGVHLADLARGPAIVASWEEHEVRAPHRPDHPNTCTHTRTHAYAHIHSSIHTYTRTHA
jgi:hypothetical protein